MTILTLVFRFFVGLQVCDDANPWAVHLSAGWAWVAGGGEGKGL